MNSVKGLSPKKINFYFFGNHQENGGSLMIWGGIKSSSNFGSNVKRNSYKIRIVSKFRFLTLSCTMLKNGQTYFKNLAVFTPQDF